MPPCPTGHCTALSAPTFDFQVALGDALRASVSSLYLLDRDGAYLTLAATTGLDRFQIDPVFSGSQLTDIRSTVGKQITPELLVTYSQSLNSDKESVVQLEWRLANSITLQALRDENGVYSINVRRRQRF